MAGFGDNDEVVKPQSAFGSRDEVVSSPQHGQELTNPPTFMDRISTELNGGGAALDPEKIFNGLGSSLGRTTQAWGDMFSGQANPSTLAEMVPLVGPLAIDASRKFFTPGQRLEGATDIAAMLAPGAVHLPETFADLPESVRSVPSVVRGAVEGGVRGAFPVIEYGAHKLPIPASLAGAAAGHFAGSPFGPIGSEIGSIVGAGAPMLRGAIQGGRDALENFRTNELLNEPVPVRSRGDVFSREGFTPPSFDEGVEGNYAGVRLPSGRAIGPSPRVNEANRPAVALERTPLWRDIVPSQSASPEPVAAPSGLVALPSGRIPGGATQGGIFSVPNEEKILSPELRAKPETPAEYRSRSSSSRAKFDENGKRNQLK